MEPVMRHVTLSILAWSTAMASTAQPAEPTVGIVKRIETEFGRPFADVVRLHQWSVYGTANRFAEQLGVSRDQLDALLKALDALP